MANWIKYKDQPRINLDNYCFIFMSYDKKRISFYSGNSSNDGCYSDRWDFNDEQEAQKCLEWFDKISGSREFKIEEPRPKKEYVPYNEPEMPF